MIDQTAYVLIVGMVLFGICAFISYLPPKNKK